MVSAVSQRPEKAPVIQFSIFTDNKVGRLNELIQKLTRHNIHVMALSQLDTTECTVVRLVVNYPESARATLSSHRYGFTETEILAVEMDTEERLKYITAALVEAEINIHYLYPFLSRPRGCSALAIYLEDNDLAADVLRTHGIKVLDQHDIGR